MIVRCGGNTRLADARQATHGDLPREADEIILSDTQLVNKIIIVSWLKTPLNS